MYCSKGLWYSMMLCHVIGLIGINVSNEPVTLKMCVGSKHTYKINVFTDMFTT